MKHLSQECLSTSGNGLREALGHTFRAQIIQWWPGEKLASASVTQRFASRLCPIDSPNFRDGRLLGTRAVGILLKPLRSQRCSCHPPATQNECVVLEIASRRRSRFVSRRMPPPTEERAPSPIGRVGRTLRLAGAPAPGKKVQVACGRGSSARRGAILPPGSIIQSPEIVPFVNLTRDSNGTAQKIRATRSNTPLDIRAAAGCRSW
jgi:hypothetical protein